MKENEGVNIIHSRKAISLKPVVPEDLDKEKEGEKEAES
jgi:hypothetical protein